MMGVGLAIPAAFLVMCAVIEVIGPFVVGVVLAAFWVLFCWGGWPGRVISLSAFAFLTWAVFT